MKEEFTFQKMLESYYIKVPTYQRAFSWDEDEVKTYLNDLLRFKSSNISYYIGHFLYEEETADGIYYVIDGHQRLTTSVLFLNAAFERLHQLKGQYYDKNVLKRDGKFVFETVDYDAQVLRDIIEGNPLCSLETASQNRLSKASKFFEEYFADKDNNVVTSLINTLLHAICSAHVIKKEVAVQIFIFQNNRGKKPTKLEMVKAFCIDHIQLYAKKEEKEELLEEMKNRFGKIYKAISKVGTRINEDYILTWVAKVFFNSLAITDIEEQIKNKLQNANLEFIRKFILELAQGFDNVEQFYNMKDQCAQLLILIDKNAIILPFFLKAKLLGLDNQQVMVLMENLGSIFVRDMAVRTRADLSSRLNDVFQKMDNSKNGIECVIERIKMMKNSSNWWYGYWKDEIFEQALSGGLPPKTAKILLWCYENHLIKSGKSGYQLCEYSELKNPQLEHIAPQTENPASGYPVYDEDFKNNYLNCLGNYLLLTGQHNISIGNKPFKEKRATYTSLLQQREICDMTPNEEWTKENIKNRQNKIIKFILEKF